MIETTGPAYPSPAAERARNPEFNPYAPPKANVALRPPGFVAGAEATRRELLNHETSIRSIGTLYYLSFGVLVLGAVTTLVLALAGEAPDTMLVLLGLSVLYGLLAWLSFYLARGLRRLERRIRGPVTVLAVIGLIGFPLGTIINAYILYLLHSDKGKRVMTPEYQAIVEQTPHIKYRTPVWLLVLLALIVALIVFVIVAAILS